MKDSHITPEARNQKIREHLAMIANEFPLLAEFVKAIASFDTSRVRHLAKEISQVKAGSQQTTIERLKTQVGDLDRKLKKRQEMATSRIPGYREEGEVFENICFVDRVKIIFKLIFRRIRRVNIV